MEPWETSSSVRKIRLTDSSSFGYREEELLGKYAALRTWNCPCRLSKIVIIQDADLEYEPDENTTFCSA